MGIVASYAYYFPLVQPKKYLSNTHTSPIIAFNINLFKYSSGVIPGVIFFLTNYLFSAWAGLLIISCIPTPEYLFSTGTTLPPHPPHQLDITVMGIITGARYCHSVSLSLKREMLVKNTNHHKASVDHVTINSWYKFGACSTCTHRYCNIELIVSS